jgi:hypothetical protein
MPIKPLPPLLFSNTNITLQFYAGGFYMLIETANKGKCTQLYDRTHPISPQLYESCCLQKLEHLNLLVAIKAFEPPLSTAKNLSY